MIAGLTLDQDALLLAASISIMASSILFAQLIRTKNLFSAKSDT